MVRELRSPRTYGPPTEGRLNRIEETSTKFLKDLNDRNNRGGQWTERRVKANYTAKPWDRVLVDPRGGPLTILVPDPKTCIGAQIAVKNITSSTNQISVGALKGTVEGFALAMTTALEKHTITAAVDGWWEH
jgi:hypothetical protein